MPDLDGTVLMDNLDFDVGEKNLNIWSFSVKSYSFFEYFLTANS